MGTLLKFLLLALAVVWLWHSPALRSLRNRQTAKPPAPPETKPKPEPRQSPDTIVSCSHCGLHVPEAEAFHNARQQPFCSAAHRDLHP
jgi:uncharacterized protein